MFRLPRPLRRLLKNLGSNQESLLIGMKLFHGTSSRRLERFEKTNWDTGSEWLYLAKDPEAAASYAEMRAEEDQDEFDDWDIEPVVLVLIQKSWTNKEHLLLIGMMQCQPSRTASTQNTQISGIGNFLWKV